jgi:glycosyltransferase involved in cell wall biosynthesis
MFSVKSNLTNRRREMGRALKDLRILFLASTDGSHTGRSGYTILNEYVPNSILIEAHRTPANTVLKRVGDAISARISLSRWSRRSSLRMELKAYSILKRQKIDVVHYLWGDRDIGFLDFFKKDHKIKLVISLHNCVSMLDETFNFPGRFRNFDALVLMSNVQRKYFENAGVAPEKIHVVLHGIDCNHFKPSINNKKDNTFTLLSVGSWQRNFTVLSEICRKLGNVPNLRIKIISNAKFRYLFEDQKHVDFQSGLSNEELLKAYQEASCLLMTAEDATANNALLEGLACGLPVVTERVGGIPEYVNEKCALFCDSVDSFVENIIRISASAELQKEMSLASRQRALELDWKNSARQLQEIYNQL